MSAQIAITSREHGCARAALAIVGYAACPNVGDLIAPRLVDRTFTQRERRLSAAKSNLDSWAGRLAAKLATIHVLDLDADTTDLCEIEILPTHVRSCRNPALCNMGHPPSVHLAPEFRARHNVDTDVEVTISHDGGYALAITVWRAARTKETT